LKTAGHVGWCEAAIGCSGWSRPDAFSEDHPSVLLWWAVVISEERPGRAAEIHTRRPLESESVAHHFVHRPIGSGRRLGLACTYFAKDRFRSWAYMAVAWAAAHEV
jgi:hypothetical protein